MKLGNIRSLYFPLGLMCLVFILLKCADRSESLAGVPDKIDFNYHVRPILSQNCFVCHGPDSSSREANLRLDTYKGATALLTEGGYAVKPHHPGKSKILNRVKSEDPEFYMPPPEMKNRLSVKEIAILEKWIDQGAEWKPHWSFLSPTYTKNSDDLDPSDIIDGLIQNAKTSQELDSVSRAEPNVILRRIAYLLTGLPPTKSEMDSFLSDDVFPLDGVLNYYLSSIHYGERWARHWMDLMRYAEHMGHEFDFPITGAWHYRDYLIRAFNNDVPYNLFVKEHLAGDMLSEPRMHPTKKYNESVIGTAFYNLGEGKHSPVSIKEEESIRIDNTIDVISKSFLGLTIACAKCHDHKFDPIPTTDYYAMYGLVASARPGPILAYSKPVHKETAGRIRKIKESISQEVFEELKKSSTAQFVDSKIIEWRIDSTLNDSTYTIIGDFTNGRLGKWQSHGLAFDKSLAQKNIQINTKGNLEINGSIASSRSSGTGISGNLKSPYFIIEHDSIVVLAAGSNSTIRVIVDNFQLIQNPLYGTLQRVVDHEDMKALVMDVSMVKGHKAYIEFIPGHFDRHKYQLNSSDYIEVSQVISFSKINPLKARTRNGVGVDQLLEKWDDHHLSHSESVAINNFVKKSNFNLKRFANHGLQLNQMIDSLRGKSHFMGVTTGDPVYSPVFNRGNYNDPLSYTVPHRFLSVLTEDSSQFIQSENSRLQWAEAIVQPNNPLTSRVMVNRIWHHLFGRGIVESVDNFGLQGSLPSHPALLDYLSLLFVEDGWSIKKLIKHILLTETFQQSTIPSASNKSKDPLNIYLHHFPVRRLEAEAIRDGLLATTENLNDSVYGQPVPIHLNEFMTGRGRPSVSGPLDGNGRRSVYTSIRRNFLSPMMLVFDMPIPFSTFGKRNVTNVPAQSLTLLNDPLVHDQAAKWAKQIQSLTSIDFESKVKLIYRQAFTREPTETEITDAKQFFENLALAYKVTGIESFENIHIWTDYCHSIFNFKEFIYLL